MDKLIEWEKGLAGFIFLRRARMPLIWPTRRALRCILFLTMWMLLLVQATIHRLSWKNGTLTGKQKGRRGWRLLSTKSGKKSALPKKNASARRTLSRPPNRK